MQFYQMGEGEQKILYAYMAYEFEQRLEEKRQLDDAYNKMR